MSCDQKHEICQVRNGAILQDVFTFDFENVTNEAILQTFSQRQKQSNSARLPSKIKIRVQS